MIDSNSTPAAGETGSLEVFVFDTEKSRKLVNAAVTIALHRDHARLSAGEPVQGQLTQATKTDGIASFSSISPGHI